MKSDLLYKWLIIGLLLTGCVAESNPTDVVQGPKALIDAVATYEYQREMYVDSLHRVELVIGRSLDSTTLYELATSFADSEHLTGEEVRVGDAISARLIDPSGGTNYRITSLSLETQRLIDRDSFGHLWQWDVMPLVEGNLPLRLKAITRVNGEEVDIPVFDTNIRVIAQQEDGGRLPVYIGIVLFLIGSLVYVFRVRRKQAERQQEAALPAGLAAELGRLVGDGDTEGALDRLERHLEAHESERLADLLVLKSSFQENKRKSNLNVIDADDAEVERSRVNYALLELIRELKAKD